MPKPETVKIEIDTARLIAALAIFAEAAYRIGATLDRAANELENLPTTPEGQTTP